MVVVVVLKVKLLLATNLGGGKLVLLASSEMEQDFLTRQLFFRFFPFLNIQTFKQTSKQGVGYTNSSSIPGIPVIVKI